jgi:hypothetical protein
VGFVYIEKPCKEYEKTMSLKWHFLLLRNEDETCKNLKLKLQFNFRPKEWDCKHQTLRSKKLGCLHGSMTVKAVCLYRTLAVAPVLSIWIKICQFDISFLYCFTLLTQLGKYSIYLSDIYSVMHECFNTVMDK